MADYNLKASLNKLKAAPFNFALIEGKDSNMVLVTPKPAPGKMLDETKEECGAGKRVAKGVVMREDGQIVFATRGAPMPAWKAVIKKIFQDQKCSAFLPIELRQLGNHESDEVATDDTEAENSGVGTEENSTAQANEPQQSTPPPSQQQTQQAQPAPQAPPAPAPKPNQPAPQPAQATPPPPAPPLAASPEAESLFKKRYQNYLIAELKVPANEAQLKAQLKAAMGLAKGFGDQHNYNDGNKKLDEVEKLLSKAPAVSAPQVKGSLVTYIQAKLAWRTVRTQVQTELQKVEQAILEACNEEPNLGEIAGKVKKLYTILNTIDERLIDKLDEALKAPTPEKKDFADQQSRSLIKEYLAFVNGNQLMGVIDNNPFAPVDVKGRLVATLTDLDNKIV
jgi:flagellar motor protein MotB